MPEYKNSVMNALAVDGTLSTITNLQGPNSQIARLRRAVRPLFKPLFDKWGNAKNIDVYLENEKAKKIRKAKNPSLYQENVHVDINMQNSTSTEFDGLLSPSFETRKGCPTFGLRFLRGNKGHNSVFSSHETSSRSLFCLTFRSKKQMYFALAASILLLALVIFFSVYRF